MAKVRQKVALPPKLAEQSTRLGNLLASLRIAKAMKQAEAAIRAGISRNSAYRIEHGDPGVAVGQVLRYLHAISPGVTLETLFAETDPSLEALAHYEMRRRVRDLSAEELKELDF